jgi:hypothetical protein
MKRRAFKIVVALSLLLFVATGVLWVRSYWHRDVFTLWFAERRACWVESCRGGGIQFVQMTNMATDQLESGWDVAFPADPLPTEMRLGFGFVPTTSPPNWDGGPSRQVYITVVVFPAYALMILLAVLPTTWAFTMIRRSRRVGLGHCLHCGYDLRASPDRCPECGTEAGSRSIPQN